MLDLVEVITLPDNREPTIENSLIQDEVKEPKGIYVNFNFLLSFLEKKIPFQITPQLIYKISAQFQTKGHNHILYHSVQDPD